MTGRLFLMFGVLWTSTAAAVQIRAVPLSPRNANYRIHASLSTADRTIHGSEILAWTNLSSVPARELRFHLYMNAFKNNRSTWMRESGRRGGLTGSEHVWGRIDIDSIRVGNGPDRAADVEFIHPDDSNADDQTVCTLRLPESVLPGRTVKIAIAFTTRLPRLAMRTGFKDDFFMVAQWFPKIGVFTEGKWNCHQFHWNTEFFADYGVYEVSLSLPENYVVGAVGRLTETLSADSIQTLTYLAEDVHDFAWAAWPGFKTAKAVHRNIEITVLYDRDHASSIPRYMDALKRTLDFFMEKIGSYPYPCVTVVDPPTGASAAGGMEYPTLITADTFWKMPRGIRFTESVVAHEFGHAYWYGMVGSNEFEEAWLDEGINSYSEMRIMDAWFGADRSMLDLPGIRIGETSLHRAGYLGMVRHDKILRNAWSYVGGGYGVFSYSKPALMLKTFENLAGVKTMDLVLKTYFERWKFRHPRTADFLAVVDEVAGPDYGRFFDQALNGSLELDYEIHSVSTSQIPEARGIFDRGRAEAAHPEWNLQAPAKKQATRPDSPRTFGAASGSQPMFRSVIKVHRNGEMTVPVEVLMVFEKGDSIRQTWDGQDRWIRYEFTKPVKLLSAEADPGRKLALDSDFTNNSKTVEPDGLPALSLSVRFLQWFQWLLQAAAFLS